MNVATTGPREGKSSIVIKASLIHLSMALGPDLTVIQGGARGMDRHVREICGVLGIDCLTEDADWPGPCDLENWCKPNHRRKRWDGSEFCPAAGLRRNQLMLDKYEPAMVIAFVDCDLSIARGTRDMIIRSETAGIVTVRIDVRGEIAEAIELIEGGLARLHEQGFNFL